MDRVDSLADPAMRELPPADRIATAVAPKELRTASDIYQWVPRIPGWSIGAINGRIVMTPAGSRRHGWIMSRLTYLLGPLSLRRDWDVFGGSVDVCFFPARDPYCPDLVIAPVETPMWGEQIRSEGVILAGEIVSPGSVDVDRDEKPGVCARGGVQIMLLVDLVKTPGEVTVFSNPHEGEYRTTDKVTLGEKIHLPDPVDFELDTSIFLEA